MTSRVVAVVVCFALVGATASGELVFLWLVTAVIVVGAIVGLIVSQRGRG